MSRELKFRIWNGRKLYSLTDMPVGALSQYPAVMQYTGLKDKNGVEIYEGDILRYVTPAEFDDDRETHDTYEVLWRGHGFDARWIQGPPNIGTSALDDCDKDMEVIGNIYENPELLNSG